MDNSNLALLLGMMCGDGCLTIRTKKKGYKTYATEFYNTNLDKINRFSSLFQEVFGIKGKISCEVKEGMKKIYVFRSYSKDSFNKLSFFGFPIGLKKYSLKIPEVIWKLEREDKLNFLKGVLITDGSIRKKGNALFHMASKNFLEEMSNLILDLFGIKKEIKEYTQKGKYLSYQLFLDKIPTQEILKTKM